MSRDFDSNPGISDKLSRDWTYLGWQVCVMPAESVGFLQITLMHGHGIYLQCIRPRFEPTPEQEIFFSRVSFPGKNKFRKLLTQHYVRMRVE